MTNSLHSHTNQKQKLNFKIVERQRNTTKKISQTFIALVNVHCTVVTVYLSIISIRIFNWTYEPSINMNRIHFERSEVNKAFQLNVTSKCFIWPTEIMLLLSSFVAITTLFWSRGNTSVIPKDLPLNEHIMSHRIEYYRIFFDTPFPNVDWFSRNKKKNR